MTHHAIQRLQERYGMRLSRKQIPKFRKMAQKALLVKEFPDAEIREVPFLGKIVRVVLTKPRKDIVTVVPNGRMRWEHGL